MMPIKPENRDRYPKDWKAIRARILARAGHKCERCGVPNYSYRVKSLDQWTMNDDEAYAMAENDKDVTWIVLTIAHLDHTPEHCEDANLKALCQKCHLAYDHDHHMKSARETRHKRKASGDLFDA